jgi:hypothetical protein
VAVGAVGCVVLARLAGQQRFPILHKKREEDEGEIVGMGGIEIFKSKNCILRLDTSVFNNY